MPERADELCNPCLRRCLPWQIPPADANAWISSGRLLVVRHYHGALGHQPRWPVACRMTTQEVATREPLSVPCARGRYAVHNRIGTEPGHRTAVLSSLS